MAKFEIVRATVEHVPALVHFNQCLATETEDKELDSETLKRGVQRAFEQGDQAIYFVAQTVDRPEVVGSLMLTREWSDWRDGWILWIQSVYVLPAHRGQGAFRALLDEAKRFATSAPDICGLRLYVENENTRAQTVYHKTGFSDPNYKVLEQMFGDSA